MWQQSLLKKRHFLKQGIWTVRFCKFQNILQTQLVFSIHVSNCLSVLARIFQIDQAGQLQLNQFRNYSQKNLEISAWILLHSSYVPQLASVLKFRHKINTDVRNESHAVWIKLPSPAPIAFIHNFSPGSCSKIASKKTLTAFSYLLTGPSVIHEAKMKWYTYCTMNT